MLLRTGARLLKQKQHQLPPKASHTLLQLLRKMSSAALAVGASTSSGRLGRLMESPFSRTDLYNATTRDSFMSSGKKSKKKKGSSRTKIKTRRVSTKSSPSSSSAHKKSKQAPPTQASSAHSVTKASPLVGVDSDSPLVKRHMQYSSSASFIRPHPQATLQSRSQMEYDSPLKLLLKLNPAQPPTRSAISIRLSPSVGTRFLSHRARHGDKGAELTIEKLAHDLAKMKHKKIIVMTGAGISTSSGIPDFR